MDRIGVISLTTRRSRLWWLPLSRPTLGLLAGVLAGRGLHLLLYVCAFDKDSMSSLDDPRRAVPINHFSTVLVAASISA
jgi:hypothetical protein